MTDETPNSVTVDKGGRPTKLTDELIAKAEMYLVDYMSNDDIVPSVAGLSVYLDVAKSSIYKYKAESDRFSDTLERIESKQEQMLLKGGLLGDFNPTITKLMMSNHGYSDRKEIDHTTGGKEIKSGLGHFYGRGDDDGDSDT